MSRMESTSPLAAAPAVHRVRVLTVNAHKGFSPLNRHYVLPELREAVRSENADLVFLQEVLGSHRQHGLRHRNWSQVPQYEFLADSLWPVFAYGRNAVYPQGEHGNALLSKFPILRHDNLDVSVHGTEQRGLLHSVLALPAETELHTVCVHLGLDERQRQQQLRLLCALLHSLPGDAPVIVAGDFNDWRQRADGVLLECGLREVFSQAYGQPARSFPARWPLLCLDRIYLRNARAHAPKVMARKPWTHLSDHLPLAVEVLL
ncbi:MULTISPECIES: endonuclease/exonuclease/phosphatase family protein [Pseudomonas]|uniref:Endonuclease/exonuclease/phosphatase family protein n=2 Tax=Pseudomonas donghuensis TaxID=1163398 RepID=A0AAP0SJU6_9PSED|nr:MULTISPECIES: endonuclease/exonuclease/phosphatase family protein [Pseudomonas]KDO00024.2 endonuclease/exonuclease/phosphatase family protein [Pseudomonas donghuensis]MBF4209464.1 EEP domain-containing protein [Pseudomonas donghuensis]MBS7601442.1 endonuclease/exonuclease/phosphatase family protein [Pseudomonas sp. RC2C2]UVL22172.1 endonuclease/exonuclease/phosphatase family protein [Pseudomonas donghuensis]